ncbi:GNAT family N-acetyltransferase [Tunturiibacter lichenicola]|uniref:GNAT family N-acetyltransferase n=1 Tax=Tunturiibacter lichenicola TaxID=2051959 RepID=UPI003D9B4CF7
MTAYKVRPAHTSDHRGIAEMCALLWPDTSIEEHQQEVDLMLKSGLSGTLPGAILVSHEDGGTLNGFIEVGLRSHADGCNPTQPVGFVEGWFVYERLRGKGVGKALMHAAETWARHHGCIEMASDTWIDHVVSQKAHRALGFEVVDRCVHFRKAL